jgi:catecholate siderophore receptor
MRRFKRRPLAAAMLMVFSTPEWAFAQAQSEQTLPEVRVRAGQDGFRTETNTSATRTETPLRDIPQMVNTVPAELLRSQGASTLGDALRNVPGISYAAPEGGTQANNVYYLRGFPAGGDLFLDNVRDVGEYNRDLFNIEQVEVLKGPSSLMFGRGSAGGIIQQVSKTPGLLPIREVAVEFGSEEKKRATADFNVRTGDSSALRINGLVEESGYYRYPQGVEKTGIAPSYRFGIGERLDVTLSYYYLKTKDVTDYGQPTLFTAATGFFGMPPVSAKNYYGFADHDFTDHETQIATARIDYRLTSDLSLRNVTRWANYQRDLEATIATLRNTDVNGNAVTRSTPYELMVVTRNHDRGRTRNNYDDVLINQTELTWKVTSGAVRHTLFGGLELASEQLNRFNYNLDANPALAGVQTPTATTSLLNPDPYTRLSYTKAPNQRARAEADTVALYAQDQLEFSQQWKALVGLRWEQYSASAWTEDMTGTTAGNNTGPFSRKDSMVSGRGGVIWQPSAAQSYYVSAGNSFNPSGELGVYGTTGTNLNLTNDDLDPEENRSYEIGSQWDFAGGLSLRTSLFRNEKINQRIQSSVGTTILGGKRRVEGLELQLAGHLLPNWDVYGGIAFMNGEIISAGANQQNLVGNEPLGVPKESGSLWTVYRLGGGWEVGGGAFWSQEQWLTDANNAQIPAYTRWDATIAYVQKQYEIRLNFMNLTDELYYYGGYQNSPNRVLPGEPRAAYLTARYNF